MELWTIGTFARAARLSPKALRLYDELGLLPPAAVDNGSGYRFYDPGQLDRARLIAWLRRLGMPLARIRVVVGLDPTTAASEVAAYWTEVLAETTDRGQLAAFLVDYLAGRGTTMTDAVLGLRYAARTDIGQVRPTNEDAAYAGGRLLAVADGVSGQAGAAASTAAIAALRPLEAQAVAAIDLTTALNAAFADADQRVHEVAESTPDGEAVTTLTAMLWAGSRVGLVHIGDTRAYRLRADELTQLTHDHTWVQSLVDEGQLSPEEAARHPQRALLARAITGRGAGRPDVSVHEAAAGDSYLLCSDGLAQVVAEDGLGAVLRRRSNPDETVAALIDLAHDAGAPDNIACVVADVVTL